MLGQYPRRTEENHCEQQDCAPYNRNISSHFGLWSNYCEGCFWLGFKDTADVGHDEMEKY